MLRLRSDDPTLDDLLSRANLVSKVGDLVAACQTPHVFGVHGDWGVGKTSFLHQVQRYLTGECPQQELAGKAAGKHSDHVTVVWFEAWRYQNETVPVVALLQEIRTQLPWTARFRKQIVKMGEVTARSALLAIEDLTKKIGIQASKIEESGEKWEQANLAVALPSHVIRQHLEKAITTLLGSGKGKKCPACDDGAEDNQRLVVIVDDLDRCSSDAAYALLEGIKIYLNLRSCVFVLGMNQGIIEDAITAHMPKSDGESAPARKLRAREYMDKLCQSVIQLPLVDDPAGLLDACLEGLAIRERIVSISRAAKCLPANPRKIKTLANIIRRSGEELSEKVLQSADPDRTARCFLLIACLYQYHPDVYRVLEHQPGFYSEIQRWATDSNVKVEYASLERLKRRPVTSIPSPSTPNVTAALGELYVDPGDPEYFRLQQLFLELNAVTENEIRQVIAIL